MENIIKDFFEPGECIAVFAGELLGRSKVSARLEPAWLDIRRDDFLPVREKHLKSCRILLSAEFKSSEKLRDSLCRVDDEVFTSGGILQLFPLDRRHGGWQFERVFLDSAEHTAGSGTTPGKIKISFICEASYENHSFFSRLPDSSFPENLPVFTAPDLKKLLRSLGILLAEQLDAVFDHTLCINYFAPSSRGGYSLELEHCKEWNDKMCGVFNLKLTARFPVSEKFFVDQKLYNTACFIHEHTLDMDEDFRGICYVEDLDFSVMQSVAGQTFSNSMMRFCIWGV